MAHGYPRTLAPHSTVTELASELFGTCKRDSGDIIENTVVCLHDWVSFVWNTDWVLDQPILRKNVVNLKSQFRFLHESL